MNDVYEPMYIPILLLLLGIGYLVVLSTVVMKYRFALSGKILISISVMIYLLVGMYMIGGGYYTDGHNEGPMLFGIGFLEMIILSFAYIFIGLAVGIGKRDSR
ncbi:hypothetical protein [Alkalihalobacillus sp. CinArs1]|uniref:hypothetical protein n=1 Tax=Alkalihalobacillus sp. CinArs1 TaxID=2995314 RepID=UPI0022DD962A|nr:hypothetical protein [Alkalihalobacillus sp. CinArs1]